MAKGSDRAGGPALDKDNHDHDDHDDNLPVQSGYAVVTPATFIEGGSLVVFETFGMRHGPLGTSQAGILPPGLTTNAVMFVDSSGRLSKNLGIAIATFFGLDDPVGCDRNPGDYFRWFFHFTRICHWTEIPRF